MKMINIKVQDHVTVPRVLLFFILQVSSFSLLFGDTHYVDIASTNATPPYTNWTTAATVIQDAIDWAVSNDTVLVADGVYSSGGRPAAGALLTNRVAIDRAVTLASVNGPATTFISGAPHPVTTNGTTAVRCVYMTNGSALVGFTITNGHTRQYSSSSDLNEDGGGIYCVSVACVISNCVVTGNTCYDDGGGCRSGTLRNCLITGNWAGNHGGGSVGATFYNSMLCGNTASGWSGGGADNGTLYNCTLMGNSARNYGGGCVNAKLYNCIVYYNKAGLSDDNVSGGTASFTCSIPLLPGVGNITNDPCVSSVGIPHLLPVSPCINKGTNQSWMAGEVEIDGEPRLNGQADIGADEMWPTGLTGAMSVAVQAMWTNVSVDYAVPFSALVSGKPQGLFWSFGDGNTAFDMVSVRHAYAVTGTYFVVLTASNMDGRVSATSQVHVLSKNVYVALSGNDSNSGSNWGEAKATIQAGIDSAPVGGVVWVSNGVHQTGGVSPNRISIAKPLTVQSLSGSAVTLISGSGSVRCAYIGDDAYLAGFTLTNGTGNYGGGAYCESIRSTISNCVISGCVSSSEGAGVYRGVLYDCILCGNTSQSGGGGASRANLVRCRLYSNVAGAGAGAYYGFLDSCLLTGNFARGGGGGSQWAILRNCTVTGNEAVDSAGGVLNGSAFNSIIYFNEASRLKNCSGVQLSYCCTWPTFAGVGNITNQPGLAGIGNPHLLQDSPCIEAGSNGLVSVDTDLDGGVRIQGPYVDIGADEFEIAGRTGGLAVAISAPFGLNVVVGYPITLVGDVNGRPLKAVWDFGDGICATNLNVAMHSFSATGSHTVSLSASNLDTVVSAAATVDVIRADEAVWYVATNGNDVLAGTNWNTAKFTIQAAVEAASSQAGPGSAVVVSNGFYADGGVFAGGLTSRVAITMPITLRSLNGPEVTHIVGKKHPNGTNGSASIRGIYMTDGVVLSGFTITNGTSDSNGTQGRNGAGIYVDGGQAIISNCVIQGCYGTYYGGGVYGGILWNCRLTGNTVGIGVGGGVVYGTLYNCLLAGNSGHQGGGAANSTLHNCTVTGNKGALGMSSSGGGVYASTLNGSIIYSNDSPNGTNWYVSTMYLCCTIPALGAGCITNPPLFVAPESGDYRLSTLSPCIDRNINQEWMLHATDIEGIPRIINGKADVGAYEFHYDGNVRMMLQGSYDTDRELMTTSLATSIPHVAPYEAGRQAVAGIPSNVVDWVLLQVQSGLTNSPAVARSLFLRNDGMITDAAGDTNILIEVPPLSTNYLVISHRNHLSVMSAQPLVFTNQLMTYDFTTNWTCYYGGTNACVELEPGVWGMIAGDADGDGKITPVDRKIVEQQAGKAGYLPGDLNLDGVVTTNEP